MFNYLSWDKLNKSMVCNDKIKKNPWKHLNIVWCLGDNWIFNLQPRLKYFNALKFNLQLEWQISHFFVLYVIS